MASDKTKVLVGLVAIALAGGTIGTFRVNLRSTHIPATVNPFFLAHPLPKSARQAAGFVTRSRMIQQPAVLWPKASDELGRSDIAERRTFYASSMAATLLLTVGIGSAILCAGRGLSCCRDDDREEEASDLHWAQKWLCPIAVVSHLTVITSQVAAAVSAGRLSKETGLPWESYQLILACGCAWLLLQSATLTIMKPGEKYSVTCFGFAMIPALTPYVADPFDSLKDALLAGLLLAGETRLLQALGCLSLAWLWGLHIVMLYDGDLRLELQRGYCSVLKAKPIVPPKQGDAAADKKNPNKSTFKTFLISKAFPQVTPERRRSLALEDGPQGLLAVAYTVLTGGLNVSIVLSIGIPLARYAVASIVYPLLLRQHSVALWLLAQKELAGKASQRADEADYTKHFIASLLALLEARDSNAANNYEPLATATQAKPVDLHLQPGGVNDFLSEDLAEVPLDFAEVEIQLEDVGIKGALNLLVACARMPSFKIISFGDYGRRYDKATGELNLEASNMGPNGAKQVVQALQTLPKVTEINIRYNNLGPEGARIISEALPGSLTVLDVEMNELGKEGARFISEALRGSPNLTDFNIGYNCLGDEGARFVAEAVSSLPELTTINISTNGLGVEGARVICEVLPQTKIKHLSAWDINFGEEEQRLLKEACEKIGCNFHL